MKIRKMKISDIKHLVRDIKGNPEIEDYSGEYSEKVFNKMLKDKDIIVLVAEEKGKAAAFLEIKIDKSQDRIYLESLFVSKDYRGKGIASELIRELENIAKDKKFKRISFVVRKWNKAMNDLCKKFKFIEKDELIFWEKEI